MEQLRLRERLARLSELQRQSRGIGVSGELERLKRQIERIEVPSRRPTRSGTSSSWRATTSGRTRSTTWSASSRTSSRCTAIDRTSTTRLSSPASDGSTAGRSRSSAIRKGRDIHERTRRNFGMAFPEGYRKAIRLFDLADRHRFPVLSLIDTPGAYPGLLAEQHGQGGWIARCQLAMVRLNAPSVACVIGEGGSGGAVAIARGRPRADAGERDLLGHLAGRLCRDPVEGRRREARRLRRR